jgi:hypothetical protein
MSTALLNRLMPDEKIVYQTKLHWIVVYWPIMFSILFLFLTLLSLSLPTVVSLLFQDLMLSATMIFMLWSLFALLKRDKSEIAVTNKRILIKRCDMKEIDLNKIKDIIIIQTMQGCGFNYGKVIIIVNENRLAVYSIQFVDDPEMFKKSIYAQINLLNGGSLWPNV